jgi:hypothetical protein
VGSKNLYVLWKGMMTTALATHSIAASSSGAGNRAMSTSYVGFESLLMRRFQTQHPKSRP